MSEPVRHAVEQVDDDLHNLIGIRWLFVGSIWRVVLPFWLLLMMCGLSQWEYRDVKNEFRCRKPSLGANPRCHDAPLPLGWD